MKRNSISIFPLLATAALIGGPSFSARETTISTPIPSPHGGTASRPWRHSKNHRKLAWKRAFKGIACHCVRFTQFA